MLTLIPAPVGLVGLAGHLRRNPLADPGLAPSPAMVAAARAIWAGIQADHGFKGSPATRVLTAPDANQKIAKSKRLVWSITLAPAMSSGAINTCVRFADCEAVCVLLSGMGELPAVQRSRNARTALLYRAPAAFAVIVADEIRRAARKADALGKRWGIRLNAASDIPWELAAPWLLANVTAHGGRAYDYTKSWGRHAPKGYTLVRSVDSRQSVAEIGAVVRRGENVAVIVPVRKGETMPTTWNGLPMIDGDISDARCDDRRGVVVGLRAKGKLRGVIAHPMVRSL